MVVKEQGAEMVNGVVGWTFRSGVGGTGGGLIMVQWRGVTERIFLNGMGSRCGSRWVKMPTAAHCV